MAIKRELIQFTIVNSTDCDYNIPMFQQNVYSVNATTKYSWDVTTAVLSCGTGTIVVNSITYPLTYAATLTGLLSALNALGFGFFCTETVSGSTYIYVVDDTNVYGDLDLCPSGITTTTTTTTTTAGTTTSTTTSTTTGVPTTSTTSTTTTVPTTSTTSSTTTGVPTTSTTSTTTTVPSTSTTTTTTTGVPTTSTTSTTTTDVPTTSTTSTTTTVPETSTTTTTSTTTAPTTSTTTTTTTLLFCNNYNIEGAPSIDVEWIECDGTPNSATVTTAILICAQTGSVTQTGGAGNITQLGACTTPSTTTTTSTTTAPVASTSTTTSTTTAPETSTTTTTTTVAPTTSTTTTTTTLLAAPLRVENVLSLDISVSNVTVNAVTAAPLTGSYPIPAGENRDLTTTQFGTYDITVTFTNTVTGQRITVTDSNSVSQCQTVNTSSTFTFPSCAVDGLTQVLILCEDGVCPP